MATNLRPDETAVGSDGMSIDLSPFPVEAPPASVAELMQRILIEPSAIFTTPFARAYSLMDTAWRHHGWAFRAGYGDSVTVSKGGGQWRVTDSGCACPGWGIRKSCAHSSF